MPGYDDLTPDQIIYIIHVIAFVVTLNVVLLLIKTYFNLRISRFIYFKIEKEIADKILERLRHVSNEKIITKSLIDKNHNVD